MRHYLMIMEFILDILHSFLLKKKTGNIGFRYFMIFT